MSTKLAKHVTIPNDPDDDYSTGPNRARVNAVEYDALKALAEYEGINLSAAVRLAIREATRVRGLWPLKERLFKEQPDRAVE